MKHRWLRGSLAAAGVLALASLARADAPPDQYGLFNATDTVIVDTQTGLTWQRYPPSVTTSFQGAATYCATLSLGQFATGWRVPSYKELLTLVNETPDWQYYEVGGWVPVYVDANAFPQTQPSPYWSSSLYPGSQDDSAYCVDFSSGAGSANLQSSGYYVRCVH